MATAFRHVLVTGGAGYVGAVLVPKLLAHGYRVTVVDLYIFGEAALASVSGHPELRQVKGDIRDRALLERELTGVDAVIHLACISNDPSFELNPALGKSINYDAFLPLVDISKDRGVRRFIYASSSSVYGIKEEEDVTEDLPLTPLTDYSKYKALCEEVLLRAQAPGFTTLILRPATVCGDSPRLRLDLTVNILTNLAVNRGRITVFGGAQKRPNIHIEDVTDLYVQALEWDDARIAGETFNAGYENHTVAALAEMVREVVGREQVSIETTPTNDHRSYHISSEKIKRALGFEPRRTVEDAVRDLTQAFRAGRIPDSMDDPRYYNIKTMLAAKL
ncbi:MAG: UDP-glucose 4-epimerase [Candidatus Rokubacteria bacterium GWA2_70_23]|nr:MAG: UDP-glucose 4-epimerase [Candidatus Rokubacteria bacterium GWA2_70_23]